MLLPLLKSLRLWQWPKNLFVLAPLVFAEGLTEPTLVVRGFLAFFFFSASSSAVYLVNDLLDREKDRLHPVKRLRPLAAGTLKPGWAFFTASVLGTLSVVGALALNLLLAGFLVAYLTLNLLYSFSLKRVVILDVMAVSLGYVLRVQAGGAAVEVEISTWLLLCTIFLALFLTFSKRRHELVRLAADASIQREVLTQYSPAFLDQMINVVTASTLLSYALYAVAPETVEKFQSQNLIYTIPFVLFGIFRYLYLVHQVSQERNPTEAILFDRPFVANVVLWGVAVVCIIYFL